MSKICSECSNTTNDPILCNYCNDLYYNVMKVEHKSDVKCPGCKRCRLVFYGPNKLCWHCICTPDLKICNVMERNALPTLDIHCRSVDLKTCPCSDKVEMCQKHLEEHEKTMNTCFIFLRKRRKMENQFINS